jgi:predicted ArsR family transcriptional regulator
VDDLDALSLLTDSVRRAAYDAVVASASPVGRDEIAAALGVGRTLAAFHLDKLVDAGLLEASFARRTGKSGPGAGRPAKLYHRAAAERAVSVPPRTYGSAAELLAEALERSGGDATLFEVAGPTRSSCSRSAGTPQRSTVRKCACATVPSTGWRSSSRRWCAG